MRKSKAIKRIAAGMIGGTMLMGMAAAVPANCFADTEPNNEETLFEVFTYRFREALVNGIDDHFLTIIPKLNGRYYQEMSLHLNVLTDNYDYLDKLEKGMIVNLEFDSITEYDDILNLSDSSLDDFYHFMDSPQYTMDHILSCRISGEHYYGDINDDEIVDSFDLITYKQRIAGTLSAELTEDQFLNADINHDDIIDEKDLEQVSDYVLGGIQTFNSTNIVGSTRLDNTVNILQDEGVKTDEAFASAEMNFGVEILKDCFAQNTEKNLLVSPLSVSTALSMAANGADGKTKDEMEKVLGNGLTLEQLDEYICYYSQHLPDERKEKLYLANSMWLNDLPDFNVLEDYLETNKKYFNSEIYKTLFNSDTAKDINSWVSGNTQGMIPQVVDEDYFGGDSSIMMMLINTLYFEADWQHPYYSSTPEKFTDVNGDEHTIDALHSMETYYYDLGNADAFKKPYVNGDYSFVGILPHDNDIAEYVNNLDAAELMEGLKEYEDPSMVDLYVMIPKFKYSYDITLNDILKNMGINEAFDPFNADFSKMSDTTPLYIQEVLHKTKIELDENGTKAAAVTALTMAAGCVMPIEKKEIHIYLNRPFVYMIVDRNNLPVFMGVATNLGV